MTAIHVQEDENHIKTYDAIEGWTLMENLRDHGLPIKAECGGACCCATCHVYIAEDWLDKLPEMNADEEDMLDNAPDVKDNSRLSCQIVMDESLDGLTVQIAKLD